MPPGKKSASYPAHIGSVLTNSFNSLGLEARLKEYRIKNEWQMIVGGNISKKARPVRLVGKTLHAKVTSSPWMTELRFLKNDIITKINDRVGEGTVEEIVFKTGKIEESPALPEKKRARRITRDERLFIEKTVDRIKDKKLKEFLKKVIAKGKTLGEDG
jgi:predicted nucleic acid-binding Zn ribbon protein